MYMQINAYTNPNSWWGVETSYITGVVYVAVVVSVKWNEYRQGDSGYNI